MNHTDLLKRAFNITWRYRPLWIFGFFLALCSGGGGGGGGGNFSPPSTGGGGGFDDFGNLPGAPDIEPGMIIALIVGLFCLFILLTVVSLVVQVVTRTALIGMVRQITEIETVTVAEGWRLGWSSEAWRLFLLNLIIGVPQVIVVLLALTPLLLLVTGDTVLSVAGGIVTALAVLCIVGILALLNFLIIAPFKELAWRWIVLNKRGVISSFSDTYNLIKRCFKDIAIVWLLMFGIAIGWGIVAFIVILPVVLIVAALVGGIPAVLVYFISNSWLGAAVAGIPPALVAIVLISTAANGIYMIFQSSVWTLAYLEIQGPGAIEDQDFEGPDDAQTWLPSLDPQPDL